MRQMTGRGRSLAGDHSWLEEGRMDDIRRRNVITLLGGGRIMKIETREQQPAMPVIGYFSARSPDAEAPLRVPFLKALEEWGFVAGRNVAIEYRFAEGR